jgi:3',5'-cyclic-AMP phosphodiesterase
MISGPWQPVFGAKMVRYVEHALHPDGTCDHRLVGVRGLVHHDLASFPGAYGDVRAWGPGMA